MKSWHVGMKQLKIHPYQLNRIELKACFLGLMDYLLNSLFYYKHNPIQIPFSKKDYSAFYCAFRIELTENFWGALI